MNFAVILPNLFVGRCLCDPAEFEQLKSQGVTAILSLQSAEDLQQEGWAEAEAQAKNMVFRNVPVTDFDVRDLEYMLPACVRELDGLIAAGHTVYLHCTAGVSRSPTVAAAYLHWRLNWPLAQALARVRETRDCCPLGQVIERARRPA